MKVYDNQMYYAYGKRTFPWSSFITYVKMHNRVPAGVTYGRNCSSFNGAFDTRLFTCELAQALYL